MGRRSVFLLVLGRKSVIQDTDLLTSHDLASSRPENCKIQARNRERESISVKGEVLFVTCGSSRGRRDESRSDGAEGEESECDFHTVGEAAEEQRVNGTSWSDRPARGGEGLSCVAPLSPVTKRKTQHPMAINVIAGQTRETNECR